MSAFKLIAYLSSFVMPPWTALLGKPFYAKNSASLAAPSPDLTKMIV